VPLSAVRNDKPAPYVQVLEGNVVKHVSVELAQRGEFVTNGRSETVVAVKGIAENTQILAGALGAVREGTATKFTQIAATNSIATK
jgi:membrane fusion protein, multidrug efflux system